MDYFCLVRGADVVFSAKEKKRREIEEAFWFELLSYKTELVKGGMGGSHEEERWLQCSL